MILELFIFLFGMAVGSFLNVCIYRLPLSISLISPGSMCPGCRTKIAFYDNVPVASYLWLRGRCRHCGTAISPRYPLVELISGLFAVAVFARHGLSWEGLIVYALIAALLVIGFLASLAVGQITYIESLIGIILGGGVLLMVAWGYYLVTKKEGMGGGDIKLLAMIGAFLGWKGVIFTIFVGSAIGAAVGMAIALRTEQGRKLPIPFGPFLSLGALLFLFFGPQIISCYLRILG